VSALPRHYRNFRFHDSSFSSCPWPLVSLPFAFFFSNLFGNTTKTALVSALLRRHGNCSFDDLSLSSSPSPRLSLPFDNFFFYSLRQHYDNSAAVGAMPASRQFLISRFEPLFFSLLSSLSPLCHFLFYSFRQHYENSAGVGATPASQQFYISRIESLFFSLPSSLSPLRLFLFNSFRQHHQNKKQRKCRRYAGVMAISISRSKSLFFSLPSSLSFLHLFLFYSFRQHYENSAGVGATPMSSQFLTSQFESLFSSLPSFFNPRTSTAKPYSRGELGVFRF